MTINELKNQIEKGILSDDGLVFHYDDSRFLVDQYISEISKLKNRPVVYYDSIPVSNSVFGDVDDGNLSIVITESPSIPPINTIVVSKNKIDSSIEFPKLEPWQLKDYVFTTCSGADSDVLERFLKVYTDPYKLQNELDKINIFDSSERSFFVKKCISENLFDGLSSVGFFDFSNAIQTRNQSDVGNMYQSVDKDPLGFAGLLLKQFRSMVNVYLQDNPTEQSTGLKDKQIWAIKRVCKNYTKQQVLDRFKFLSEMDLKLKSGEITSDIMFDYILVKMFIM